MEIQRLRNLTTGRLHTEMGHVYKDLEMILGEQGLFTHMIPRALASVKPWLIDNVKDQRFWNGEYDTTHVGDFELPQPTQEDRVEIFKRMRSAK